MTGTTARTGRPWRGVPAADRDEQRRNRLLEVGLEVFGTTGYPTSTVSGLCAAAGVSTRSFYEIYADRSALLEAVYLHVCAEIEANLAALTLSETDLASWVRSAVEAVLGPLIADVRKIRVIEVEMVGVSPELESTRLATTRSIVEALAALQAGIAEKRGQSIAAGNLTPVFIEGGMSEALMNYARTDESERSAPADFLDELSAIIDHLLLV